MIADLGAYFATLDEKALEKTFVSPRRLPEILLGLVRDDVESGSRHHTLVVGPSGSGKTHLVSLVERKVRAERESAEGGPASRLLVAGPLDPSRRSTSLLDLLVVILEDLVESSRDPDLARELENLGDLGPDLAMRRAPRLLVEWLDDRPLLLFLEDLEALFANLKLEGQQRFRAFLQETGNIVILATARRFFEDVQRHSAPFYGWFRIEPVPPLRFDDAIELVASRFEVSGADLAARQCRTEPFRSRIRAVYESTGGSPRALALFADQVVRGSFDDWIPAALVTLGLLADRHRIELDRLAPLQRKILHVLARHGTSAVKDIARRCFTTPQSVSSQLGILKTAHLVDAEVAGRETHYRIVDPTLAWALRPPAIAVETMRRKLETSLEDSLTEVS